jgi:hypothetical protein
MIHHRDTEDTEVAQRKSYKSLCHLSALCVSVVNLTLIIAQDQIEPLLKYVVGQQARDASSLRRDYSCTINFDGGNIAGIPLCCQQRPVPRTLRWQGVPFCVRAPQMETVSSGFVGRSVAVPFGP